MHYVAPDVSIHLEGERGREKEGEREGRGGRERERGGRGRE